MAPGKPPSRSPKDFSAEVDALLKKLPYADAEAPAPGTVSGPRRAGQAPVTASGNRRAVSPPVSPAQHRQANLWVWGRLALATAFAVALTQWPYVRVCGWGLAFYVVAVAAMLLAGGWCAVASWKQRLPWAHGLALILVFWGITLAAEVVLPRVGYASEYARWLCIP